MADYPDSLIEKIDAAINAAAVFRKEPTYAVLSNFKARRQFETQVNYVLSEAGFLPHAERITWGNYRYTHSGNGRDFFLNVEFEINVAPGLIAYGYSAGTAEIMDEGPAGRLLLTDVEVSFQGLQKIQSGKVSFPHGRGVFEGASADFSEVEISHEDLGRFVDAYFATAMRSGSDEIYAMSRSKESFSIPTLRQMVKDCEIFLSENISDIRRGNNSDNIEEAGIAFWNVRNTDRVGFEKTWPKMPADRLDKAARQFSGTTLEIGPDGKIHAR